jgi:hypothetical protein
MHITQHTPGLNSWLARNGCSTLALWELTGHDFTYMEANDLYAKAVEAGCYLNPNTENGAVLWNTMCQFLNKQFGCNLRFKGAFERTYVCLSGERSIDHYYISLQWPDHFVLEHDYDPSGTGNAWAKGILLNKRIILV